MKLGRFIVDTHVHAQRFAAGPEFSKQKLDTASARYNDLAKVMRLLTPYDNSPRLLHDMDCYDVDMCVLLPAFGMTNELNLEIVEQASGLLRGRLFGRQNPAEGHSRRAGLVGTGRRS